MTPNPDTNRHELEVSGMSCDSCAARVVAALQGVEGVQSASVDLESGRASIVGDSIDTNQLVEAVTRAGYGVRPGG